MVLPLDKELCNSLYLASSAGETESCKFSRAEVKSAIVTISSLFQSSSDKPEGEHVSTYYTSQMAE